MREVYPVLASSLRCKRSWCEMNDVMKLLFISALSVDPGTAFASPPSSAIPTEPASRADQLSALMRLRMLASDVAHERSTLLATHDQRAGTTSAETEFNLEGRVDLSTETVGRLSIATSVDPGLTSDADLVMRVSGGCIERQIAKDHFAPTKIYWASPAGSPQPLIGFKHVAADHDVILFFDAFGRGCLNAVRSEAHRRK